MRKAFSFLSLFWKCRSLLATVFFVVVVGFVDDNSVVNLLKQWQVNSELRAEIDHYEQEYSEANTRLRHLANSQEAVEEVARVNLLMKSEDEDVYLIE